MLCGASADRRRLDLEHDRDRPVVDELDRHPRSEAAGCHRRSKRSQFLAERLVERRCPIRRRRVREARSVSLRRIFITSASNWKMEGDQWASTATSGSATQGAGAASASSRPTFSATRAGRHARGHRALGEARKARVRRRRGLQVIDRRECGGRRLTGQRLTGAHSLNWLPPHRSHALRLSLPGTPLSIGRLACLRPPPTYSCRCKWHTREHIEGER